MPTRFVVESTRGEGKCVDRLLIQPLGVLDEQQERTVPGKALEQGVHREPDEKSIGRGTGGDADGDPQRLALRYRKTVLNRIRRTRQPLDGCEWEIGSASAPPAE